MFPWTEPVINWDGSVLPCCAVYSESMPLGISLRILLDTSGIAICMLWRGKRFQGLKTKKKQFAIYVKGTDICRIVFYL
jgi:hypothetical protein